ncbi:MAG: hypothetical protein QNJ65_10655 [Xenococcaceae cyanobacterium MO_234.B1]|nr:hypothetical protein [Xenococcaceae cyanobacterium MO_234.B1]
MTIKYFGSIHNYLVAVYYTPTLGWRYSILLHDGSLFQPYDLYQTGEEAYEVAKSIIYLVMCDDVAQESISSD